MSNYDLTPQQEKAIREYLHKSIVPLIEDVLVKKLGQAMSYAAQELIKPKREWHGLTDEDWIEIMSNQTDKTGCELDVEIYDWIEAKLKEKNS